MTQNSKTFASLASHSVRYLLIAMCGLAGCAISPPSAPTGVLMPGSASIPSAPMTLPRFLGVDSLAHGARRVVYRSRVRLATWVPLLEPNVAGAVPLAVGDPACLESPAPAVATAASIQQAEASAPGKVKALGFLATLDCSRNPQVEEALLAAMDDPSESVRIAAVEAIIAGQQRCTSGSCGCGGCCTPAIQQRLQRLASEFDARGCPCEASPRVRRLARIAACSCGQQHLASPPPIPEEMPSPEVIEMLHAPNPI